MIRGCTICAAPCLWLSGHDVSFFLFLPADNLISCPCYKDAHQGTDEVEEAIGEIGDCRYAEDSGLGHAASVPGYKYGGHGNGIFSGAAQQAAFVTVAVIYVLEHVAGEDDGDVLVGSGNIEEQTGCYG